jgi:hypothetical protein
MKVVPIGAVKMEPVRELGRVRVIKMVPVRVRARKVKPAHERAMKVARGQRVRRA